VKWIKTKHSENLVSIEHKLYESPGEQCRIWWASSLFYLHTVFSMELFFKSPGYSVSTHMLYLLPLLKYGGNKSSF